MTTFLIVVSIISFVGIVIYLLNLFSLNPFSQNKNLTSLMSSQRQDMTMKGAARMSSSEQRLSEVLKSASMVTVSNKKTSADSKLTIEKKLRYAQWKMKPVTFHVLEISLALLSFLTIGLLFSPFVQFLTLTFGPLFMRWLLNSAVEKRFKLFDQDYAPFLMSLVGLLKTGMTPLTAIEAASSALEQGSLIKLECELMMERLRFGVPEDNSIGSFAEDVFHPEIELFVQALLLSKRVGGTLSDTLDRLARQVRKRQYFRKQAVAAVGMQRGSIWFILGIMVTLMLYLYVIYPECIVGAIKNPVGWAVYQFGFVVIGLGIFWVRQVTKIKV